MKKTSQPYVTHTEPVRTTIFLLHIEFLCVCCMNFLSWIDDLLRAVIISTYLLYYQTTY